MSDSLAFRERALIANSRFNATLWLRWATHLRDRSVTGYTSLKRRMMTVQQK
jgi:hypothetical protein